MQDSTKKGLLIVSVVLIATGVVAYFYNKNKKTSSEKLDDKNIASDPVVNATNNNSSGTNTQSNKTASVIKNPEVIKKPIVKKLAASLGFGDPTPIKVATQKAQIVGANTVLSNDIHGADAKAIYALFDGSPVFNMNNQQVGKTKRAQYLGVASYAKESAAGGFVVYFLGTSNVKYFIYSDFIGVKVN